jgi:nicotinamidase/pyrazinamidase
MKSAVIYIDLQNDFFEGGTLGVRGTDLSFIDNINRISHIANADGLFEVRTRDWHLAESTHFNKWPVHCVQNSFGAQFKIGLDIVGIDVIDKGMTSDGYSAFDRDARVHDDPLGGLDLDVMLHNMNVRTLWVCGLATDYCVKATAIDGVKLQYNVNLILDGVAAVNLHPRDGDIALTEMLDHGVQIVTLRQFNNASK